MLTSFPPPAGFDGDDEGEPGDPDYWRTLTQAELEALDHEQEDEEAERAALLAAQEAARRRFFGFDEPRGNQPAQSPTRRPVILPLKVILPLSPKAVVAKSTS